MIACMHDRDLVVGGVEWLDAALARWQAAGTRLFIDLRELTSALNLELALDREPEYRARLRVRRHGGPPLKRSFPALIHTGERPVAEIMLTTPAAEVGLEIERLPGSLSRVQIPAGKRI